MKQRTLTAVQFAKEIGASYPTVVSWLSKGIVPGAVKQSDDRGEYWEIPEVALNMERPKRGPKAKKASGQDGKVVIKKGSKERQSNGRA